MGQSVKGYIQKRFSAMLFLSVAMGVIVGALSGFVFHEKNKSQQTLQLMNIAVGTASRIQDLSGAIAVYSVRGDGESYKKVEEGLKTFDDSAFVKGLLPKDRTLFMANVRQIKILGKILLSSRNPVYRQQLSVSVQNLAQGVDSGIVFPQIQRLREQVDHDSSRLSVALGFLVFLFLLLVAVLVLVVVKTRRGIDRQVLSPLDAVADFSHRMSRFDFSKKEIASSHFEEIDAVSVAIVRLSKVFESILNGLPAIGAVIAEADPGMENRIVYQNRFFEELYPKMRPDLESMLNKPLPANMLGNSIHVMHPKPERIKDLLRGIAPGSLRDNMTIPVGDRMMASSTLAVPGESGTSFYVTLWQDKTTVYTLRDVISKTSEGLGKILAVKNEFGTVVAIANSGTDHVKKAFSLSSSVRQAMEKMGRTVSESRENMSGVTQQILSFRDEIQSISAIVGSISKIAAQTHVLSLNAAIEAARAGDDGRGFMVVADSVRDLAKNTEDLTTSIEGKIAAAIGGTDKIVSLISSLDSEAHTSKDLADAATEQFSSLESLVKNVGESYRDIAEKTVSGVGSLSVVDEAVENFGKLKGVKL